MASISVIVPVYRVEAYLHRCVESVLSQTFSDFELILVDDGSPDNCGAICDEFAAKDSRITVIHQANGGLSAARNAGIDWAFQQSNSEWMTFIDSDDWVHPQYLEFLYRACQEAGTDLAVCQHERTKESYIVYDTAPNYRMDCMSVHDFFCLENANLSWVNAWGKLYRKQTFAHLRYPEGLLFEDLHALPSILRTNAKVSVVYIPLYVYFLSPNSIMRSSWSPKKLDDIKGYEILLPFVKKLKNKAMYYCAMRRFLYVLGVQIYDLRETKEPAYDGYLKRLRRKMRWLLIRYGSKLKIDLKEEGWLYERAFPKLTYLYWTAVGVTNKIKRSLHICRK